ncbi:hypothetical protein ACPWT1_15735 [Ramlibacter sp. MMS24-I3-19]|uniref:hypothetical protein n=1 Tax=Ramlibacter sp. MMS24-I3-19 TaxID=3416606 RepID=UPI003D002BD3
MGWMCTLAGLLRPLRALWQTVGRHVSRAPEADASARRTGLNTAAGHGHVAWPSVRHDSRTLRVLRIVDAGHASSTAGRMVISGRMADVCAELDRLAALEAAAA